tara:strand:- start:14254 stop:15171 length:918 start_codon:yes stop_codon:yes gene_type:complete
LFRFIAIFLLLSIQLIAIGQEKVHWTNYPDTLNKKRLIGVSSGAAVITTTTLIALNELWYKDFPKSKFHTFNDWGEWEGVDKLGHGFSSYYIGVIGYHSLRWSGINEKSSIAFGATWGLVYLSAIEIMDAYNTQWGFSWGDMTANLIGSGVFIGQQLAWGEQRIVPKFSFHTTEFSQYRPELLGENWVQQLFKDYNGQTYWLSANIHSFLNKSSKFPKWISVSAGYGATGMIGGSNNPSYDENGYAYPHFDRYSQFYLSLDLDLQRINTKSRFVNSLLKAVSLFKFPLPTLEFNKNGVKFHPIYF